VLGRPHSVGGRSVPKRVRYAAQAGQRSSTSHLRGTRQLRHGRGAGSRAGRGGMSVYQRGLAPEHALRCSERVNGRADPGPARLNAGLRLPRWAEGSARLIDRPARRLQIGGQAARLARRYLGERASSKRRPGLCRSMLGRRVHASAPPSLGPGGGSRDQAVLGGYTSTTNARRLGPAPVCLAAHERRPHNTRRSSARRPAAASRATVSGCATGICGLRAVAG
jgi:hypothetical protein